MPGQRRKPRKKMTPEGENALAERYYHKEGARAEARRQAKRRSMYFEPGHSAAQRASSRKKRG